MLSIIPGFVEAENKWDRVSAHKVLKIDLQRETKLKNKTKQKHESIPLSHVSQW